MRRTLMKHQAEIHHLFSCIASTSDNVSFKGLKAALTAAGLIPNYLGEEELAYVCRKVQEKFYDVEDVESIDAMDIETFSAMLAALGSVLTLDYNLPFFQTLTELAEHRPVKLPNLGVCLLITMLVAKLPSCPREKPLGTSLACLPKDLHAGMKELDTYPFLQTPHRMTLMAQDKMDQSSVLDNLNMRIAIRLQAQTSYIYKKFKENDPEIKAELKVDDIVKGLERVGLLHTYCTPNDFLVMVRRLQATYSAPGFGHVRGGAIPVFVDPDKKTVDPEGFSFILNGMVSVLRWKTEVLAKVLGNLSITPKNLFALKFCLLVQWIYTKLDKGVVQLGPKKCLCVIASEEAPKAGIRPGSLDEDPLVPLPTTGSHIQQMKAGAEAAVKPIMMRHMVTAGAGAGVTEPLVIRKPPGMVSRLKHPSDVPVAMTFDGGPKPVIHSVRDLPRVLRSLWWQTFEFLESKGIMVLPLGVAGEIPKIKRLANYKLREDQGRKRVAILPRDDDEKGKRDLVSAYLLLRGTQQAFATQVDPPMELPHYLGEVYAFVVADIRERGWCAKKPSKLVRYVNIVLPTLITEHPDFQPYLIRRPGGACD